MMIQRYRRPLLCSLAVLAVALGGWSWLRPAPPIKPAKPSTPAMLEHSTLPDGVALTRVLPGTKATERVALAVTAQDLLSDKQLQALSWDASAEIVQVVLPEGDCTLQQSAFNHALQALDEAPTLVAGVGPGATLAWRWLAGQDNEDAQAISIDFTLAQSSPASGSCDSPLPKSAPHGQWTVAWDDGQDDTPPAFVRNQLNINSKNSNHDLPLPDVLDSELRRKLIVANVSGGGLVPSAVEVVAEQGADTVTLFMSGDGGWRDLDKEVAGHMAKMGYSVVGIDVLRYYWEHKTPEQTASDLTQLMQYYRQKWGTKRFILAGYSFGADVMPAVYNRLAPEEQNRIDGIILLAFARSGSFEIAVEGWLGAAGKEAATGPEMPKRPPAKVFCVYGKDEEAESGCTDTTAVGEKVELPGGHHFDENYPALSKRLTDAIDKRQGKPPKQG